MVKNKLVAKSQESFAQTYCNYSEVYIRSNETKQVEVAEKLQTYVSESDLIHVGVSGMQNYDFITRIKPKYAILFDINEATCDFHSLIKDNIINSKNVDEFVENISQRLTKSNFNISEEQIKTFKEKKDFWLQDDNYQYVKKMFQDDAIKIKNTNIAKSSTEEIISDFCDEKKSQVGSFYISNVADWLIDNLEELSSLENNIQSLKEKNPEMIIIYSDGTLRLKENNLEHHPIVQKVADLKNESFTLFTETRKQFMNQDVLTRRAQMKKLPI